MFDYKDAPFFTSYFTNHPDFRVIEEFKESEDKEEQDCYVGRIEVLNTIHPLEIRVEIPKSFPHKKLVFRTKSLFGYPHLIYNPRRDSKAEKYGGWFCLNTPFAETVENQLEQEIFRLKEWIARQMRPELEAIIEDEKVREALAFESAYSWENTDELSEYHGDAILSFVGDFSNDLDYFKETMGTIHCVKTPDKRFYALQNKELTNFELPYIIVDEAPQSVDTYRDFILLKNQYGWDEKICKHLLPRINLKDPWSQGSGFIKTSGKDYPLEEALDIIDKLKKELLNENAYLPALTERNVTTSFSPSAGKVLTKVLPMHKDIINGELDRIEESVRKDNGYHPYLRILENEENNVNNDYDSEDTIFYDLNILHFFAIGIHDINRLSWHLFATTLGNMLFDKVTYDLCFRDVILSKAVSCPLVFQNAQIIDNNLFFGRGVFSQSLRSKRIALVGLGALGSMVAESLARSGVSVVGLWDNDLVEPGNICRSSYQLSDLGESKVDALKKKLLSINPYIKSEEIENHGYWYQHENINVFTYEDGSFYGDINYDNQEQAINKIKNYDLIIDCTGSNELLHFLSYAVPEVDIISLCITNHSSNLVCISSKDGNPFELRKAYLSRIEQDTKNFYLEGSGCYSPTFFATNSDISSLINLFVRELNQKVDYDEIMHSIIWSHDKRGVLADRLTTYKLKGYDIRMTISSETIYDGEEMQESADGPIGYLLGCYSRNGQLIMVTHIIDAYNAKAMLYDAYRTSSGIIDYIGDYRYSGEQPNTYTDNDIETLAAKAEDESINTNNPLLAVRNPDGSVSFFLYINNGLVSLVKQS